MTEGDDAPDNGVPIASRRRAAAGGGARHPKLFTIEAHRGFADALVAGLLPRYGDAQWGLARLTLLLPNQRAARILTEAFVRSGALEGTGAGLLLPRMVAVGDLDLDEALGPLLDPIDAQDVPPAADPTERWLRCARLLGELEGDAAPKGAAALRRARDVVQAIDRLAVEGVAPADLLSEGVVALVGEQAEHWRESTRAFLRLQAAWQLEAEALGQIDPPDRRNRLFAATAKAWAASPPQHPIVAAGITSGSPALARLLRVVSELPQGAVVLPDLDLSLDDEVWDALGRAGMPPTLGEAPFGRDDAATHPQYHLKLLLGRMGVARGEVRPWHRSGPAAAPPERRKAISALFLPPAASARWVDLPEPQRRLAAVRLMECEHPGEEAQAIALLMRETLETPEKRVALVTPDRALAGRVVAHLQRWGIAADDSAGRPLPQTAAGRVLLLLASVMSEAAAPVPLVALLSHPLANGGSDDAPQGRAAWLEHVRALDLALRGPRPGPGLGPLRDIVNRLVARGATRMLAWWDRVEAILAPLFALPDAAPLADMLDALVSAGEALCGEALWAQGPGRSLAGVVEDLRSAALAVGTVLPRRDLAAALREGMDGVAVRPPWGGHPRVAIYGLLEARMARADLVLCGGLVEGKWPAAPAPDPLLPPAVLRHLGVPGADFRIGLAAHDLAACLGAPQVVLSWARRDEGGPVKPSRFVLRIEAMLGPKLAHDHRETRMVEIAQAIDRPNAARPKQSPAPRPAPSPSAQQRRVAVAVTALDGLRADPYGFYAKTILRLRKLDGLDAEPSHAWRGTAVHAILEAWHKQGAPMGQLAATAHGVLDAMSAHPLARGLWRPRLMAALEWIDAEVAELATQGRVVLASEARGELVMDGIRLHGRADRIDRLPDGTLGIVDYKTGMAPSAAKVAKGFALQLGLLGLIARQGGFVGGDGTRLAGEPTVFEYWSFGKNGEQFGMRKQPLAGPRSKGLAVEEFVDVTSDFLREAIARWLLGNEPFTAMLRPDMVGYNDYDQVMRLDEWIGWLGDEANGA
jgi:ATP-dependent helicase/nuclease subunit B